MNRMCDNMQPQIINFVCLALWRISLAIVVGARMSYETHDVHREKTAWHRF